MGKQHVIAVRLDNGKHVCDPTHTPAKPGDTVMWKGGVFVFFPGETPFVEGRGPFSPGGHPDCSPNATTQNRGQVRIQNSPEWKAQPNRRGHHHRRLELSGDHPCERGFR